MKARNFDGAVRHVEITDEGERRRTRTLPGLPAPDLQGMILQAMVESGEIALDDHEWVSGADVNLLARPAWNETVVDLAPVTHDREGTPRFGVARIGERRPLWRRIADGVAWACLAVAAVEGAWLVYFIAHEMISCGEAGRR